MSRKLALSLLILSFGLIVFLAFLFAFPLRHAFINGVVTPLIESLLVLRWYLHRISQLILWIVLVMAGALVILRVFLHTFPLPRRPEHERYIIIRSENQSDLKRMITTIERARRHPFARRSMSSELVSLSVRLIAQRERLSLREARDTFESFTWCDNDAVRDYFNFRRQYYGVGRGKVFNRRLHDIVAFLERYHQGG